MTLLEKKILLLKHKGDPNWLNGDDCLNFVDSSDNDTDVLLYYNDDGTIETALSSVLHWLKTIKRIVLINRRIGFLKMVGIGGQFIMVKSAQRLFQKNLKM